MFSPTGTNQALRSGLDPVNMEVGHATLRGWIGGGFLMLAISAIFGTVNQQAVPFRFIVIFMGCSIIGRIVALVSVGGSTGSVRALVVDVIMLAIALFAARTFLESAES